MGGRVIRHAVLGLLGLVCLAAGAGSNGCGLGPEAAVGDCGALQREAFGDDEEPAKDADGDEGAVVGGACCHGLERAHFPAATRPAGPTAAAAEQALGPGEPEHEAGLVHLPGGRFAMGSNPSDGEVFGEDGEAPPRWVQVAPFAIGKFEVSNARFAAFVQQTGYVTESETFGWSFGVEALIPEEVKATITSAVAAAPWWLPVHGADWRRPNGPGTSLEGILDHPVSQVSHADSEAFCAWSSPGGRLPTEAEWEYAARGGLQRRRYPWGDEELLGGQRRANTWQSSIPDEDLGDRSLYQYGEESLRLIHHFYNAPNSGADGFVGTCPVDEFGPQNAFGLHNIVGNVWEWVSDWYSLTRFEGAGQNIKGTKKRNTPKRSKDPPSTLDESLPTLRDFVGPAASEMGAKVKKGGSFMCNVYTCYRYRTSARMMLTPDSAASNVGFRCAGAYNFSKDIVETAAAASHAEL